MVLERRGLYLSRKLFRLAQFFSQLNLKLSPIFHEEILLGKLNCSYAVYVK